MRRPIALFICLILLASCHSRQQADLILHNGKVYTVDSAFTVAEAFAVKDGKILAVGSNKEIQEHYTASNVIDAEGKAVYPGFIDAHAHFVGYGRSLFEVALYDCKDWQDAVARVQAFAQLHPDEKWIMAEAES